MAAMSGKTVEVEGSEGSPSEDARLPYPKASVNLPYPETSVNLPYPGTSMSLPYPETSMNLPYPETSMNLPYPETSALPNVGQIMKDLGIESTIPNEIPEGSPTDTSVKPGGLGFEGFFGRPGEDVGFPCCETSGEFPNVDKIMKDLSIESPTCQEPPANITAAPDAPHSPPCLFDVGFGFKEEVLNETKDPQKTKNPPDAAPVATSEKKPAVDVLKKKAEVGKQS
ncbi:uncharacterized protein LOC120917935 isoform X2 [Rana temporaria]|uniref:uncharacterized protein LOC120917935 isoform X2 n=1 Tax=Rana temporaria TaxID=8407 RepID=UPI001AAD88A5|nr:uncharacterized protein LOC120917935 isoform X2 [Rana temporaria]